MTDDQLELRLREWYRLEIADDEPAPPSLRSGLASIPQVSPLPRRGFARRRGFTLLAAAALVGVLAGGALLTGSGLVMLPSVPPSVVPPTAPASANPSAELPSAAPTALPAYAGLIAYVQFGPLRAHTRECPTGARRLFDPYPADPGCSRIWVSNTDGTGAHELLPDHPGNQTLLEWSPDGSRLLFADDARLWLVDASGTVVQSFLFEDLCPIACTDAFIGGYEFSPDGTTIAFDRAPTTSSGDSVTALLDVATGQVTEIASTASEGNNPPHWSPDGTRLTFARQPGGPAGATLYMVNADGSNLHEYVPANLHAIEPRWSPDGSLISFLSADPEQDGGEIYVVAPDGTGLRRLTSDGASSRPEWTADGRIVYAQAVGQVEGSTKYELWIMDADGANQAKLPVEDVVQLTEAHCLQCAWVRDPDSEIPNTEFMTSALWQPQP
jgi:Tol biopolymer transport system component